MDIIDKLILPVYADSGQKFASSSRHDPYRNFNFEVLFVGKKAIYKTGWSTVSGLKMAHKYKEYAEGGNNGVPVQIHEGSAFEPVTMERGMSEDTSIIEAYASQHDSSGIGITHANHYEVIINIKDRDNKTVVKTIKLQNAWISALETGDLNAQGAEVLLNRVIVSFTNADIK